MDRKWIYNIWDSTLFFFFFFFLLSPNLVVNVSDKNEKLSTIDYSILICFQCNWEIFFFFFIFFLVLDGKSICTKKDIKASILDFFFLSLILNEDVPWLIIWPYIQQLSLDCHTCQTTYYNPSLYLLLISTGNLDPITSTHCKYCGHLFEKKIKNQLTCDTTTVCFL